MSKKNATLETSSGYIEFTYINSSGWRYCIAVPEENRTSNLMEVVRDFGYEDWGECRGKAWCRSCHVTIDELNSLNDALPLSLDEQDALSKVYDRAVNSRLACQIDIIEELNNRVVTFKGDD
ncbi:2Fe-2S iron-sulfur cluster-binding protein [Arenicella sp. 4NH20-0111]|uniref:2Fe-2S iron-sulfur cluster-binding protein n=1 Tax=Arenicella sp. 4NH20-0111 TaxID=3127648 RepID=UPI00310217D7